MAIQAMTCPPTGPPPQKISPWQTGVPTGLAAGLADSSDFSNTTSTGTWTSSAAGTGYQGYNYATHAAGSGSDAFSWNLNIPQNGNYTVYVQFGVFKRRAPGPGRSPVTTLMQLPGWSALDPCSLTGIRG